MQFWFFVASRKKRGLYFSGCFIFYSFFGDNSSRRVHAKVLSTANVHAIHPDTFNTAQFEVECIELKQTQHSTEVVWSWTKEAHFSHGWKPWFFLVRISPNSLRRPLTLIISPSAQHSFTPHSTVRSLFSELGSTVDRSGF